MTDEPDDDSCCRHNEERREEGSEEHAACGAERTPDGRFAAGHCPNPKGRPRKQTPVVQDLLSTILSETVLGSVAGSPKSMSVMEVLLRSLCARSVKETGTALAILKIVTSNPQANSSNQNTDTDEEEQAQALEHLLEREHRRRTLRDKEAEEPPDETEEGS